MLFAEAQSIFQLATPLHLNFLNASSWWIAPFYLLKVFQATPSCTKSGLKDSQAMKPGNKFTTDFPSYHYKFCAQVTAVGRWNNPSHTYQNPANRSPCTSRQISLSCQSGAIRRKVIRIPMKCIHLFINFIRVGQQKITNNFCFCLVCLTAADDFTVTIYTITYRCTLSSFVWESRIHPCPKERATARGYRWKQKWLPQETAISWCVANHQQRLNKVISWRLLREQSTVGLLLKTAVLTDAVLLSSFKEHEFFVFQSYDCASMDLTPFRLGSIICFGKIKKCHWIRGRQSF